MGSAQDSAWHTGCSSLVCSGGWREPGGGREWESEDEAGLGSLPCLVGCSFMLTQEPIKDK